VCPLDIDEGDNVDLDGACAHIQSVEKVARAKKRECEDCVRMGGEWVHLRTCQSCGGTRCCDSSPNKHASKHAKGTQHPVIASAEPGESWLYCYPDDTAVEY
jgi:hypothetical protein